MSIYPQMLGVKIWASWAEHNADILSGRHLSISEQAYINCSKKMIILDPRELQ